ncbi:hypothetical protein FM110_06980 [Brachybacterium nesterenkovii]|uniref:Uncharacterized protein n=1 Tax=Brachybacterium nesterenkovii TaxID=47847 RepID=A0A1X6WZX0_9MICO|nr:hypothetical protein FM110_06980 [Brachybacterium nesterenkovii]
MLPVEVGGVGEQLVAPRDDRVPGEALGDGELVDRVLDRLDRRELERRAVRGLRGDGAERRRGLRLGRTGGARHADRHGACGGAAEEGAAREGRGDDVAEVPVGRGVARLAEALVAALERAGDGRALAGDVVLHEQGQMQGHGEAFRGGRVLRTMRRR